MLFLTMGDEYLCVCWLVVGVLTSGRFGCVAYCPRVSVDILGTSWDQCVSMVQYCLTSTETMRLVRTDSPGRPPRFSRHSSWTLSSGLIPFLFCFWRVSCFPLVHMHQLVDENGCCGCSRFHASFHVHFDLTHGSEDAVKRIKLPTSKNTSFKSHWNCLYYTPNDHHI